MSVQFIKRKMPNNHGITESLRLLKADGKCAQFPKELYKVSSVKNIASRMKSKGIDWVYDEDEKNFYVAIKVN